MNDMKRVRVSNLERARIEAGLSRAELAKEMGVSYATIRKWETGEREPSCQMLRRLAKRLNVTTDYLLEMDISSKELLNTYRIMDIAVTDDPVTDALLFWQSIRNRPDLQNFIKQLSNLDQDTATKALQIIRVIRKLDSNETE